MINTYWTILYAYLIIKYLNSTNLIITSHIGDSLYKLVMDENGLKLTLYFTHTHVHTHTLFLGILIISVCNNKNIIVIFTC